MNDNKVI